MTSVINSVKTKGPYFSSSGNMLSYPAARLLFNLLIALRVSSSHWFGECCRNFTFKHFKIFDFWFVEVIFKMSLDCIVYILGI